MCVYIHKYIYIYTYIHTHIYIYVYMYKYVINYNYIMEMIWRTLIQNIRISPVSPGLQVVVESLDDVVDPGSSAANQHDANASTRHWMGIDQHGSRHKGDHKYPKMILYRSYKMDHLWNIYVDLK